MQPLPLVQRKGRGGRAEAARRQARGLRQPCLLCPVSTRSVRVLTAQSLALPGFNHAVRQRPDQAQSLRISLRGERAPGPTAADRRDSGGEAEPRDLLSAERGVQRGPQPHEGHRAVVAGGVYPQGGCQRLHRADGGQQARAALFPMPTCACAGLRSIDTR